LSPTADDSQTSAALDALVGRRKRSAYDQFGHAGVSAMRSGPGFTGGDFSEIFGDVFGGRGGYRGADRRYDLSLTLEEAVSGKEFKIRFPTTALKHNLASPALVRSRRT